MRRVTPTLVAAFLLVLMACQAEAAVPSSGTLTPGTPLLGYTGGPYTGANPSINVQDEPDCDLVPNTCDDYLLTVDVDQAYIDANPTAVITIKVEWPNSANDFDLFVQNPNTGTTIQRSASSADPEIVILNPTVGTTSYRVRTLVYAVANETLTGTITLGPVVGGDTGEGIYLSSSDIFTCNVHLEGQSAVFDHGGDGEPAVKFDPDGNAWVTGIAGVGGGIGLWKIAAGDVCAQSPIFLDNPDAGVGGGDTDIEIATVLNPLGFYNIYTSSLTLANITSSTSMDGGVTFVPTPISTPIPVNDRQWNAAYGQNTLYLSWREGATSPGNTLLVNRSPAAGAPGTFVGAVPVWTDAEVSDPQLDHQLGNMACDTRPGGNEVTGTAGPDGEGNVYHAFTQELNQVWIAVSRNFGLTWNSTLVYEGAIGESFDHIFTWCAVDKGGNVYTVWSDNSSVFYSGSTNIKTSDTPTWSRPIRVNNGALTRTALLPMIEAGSAGRIIVGWYGTSASSPDDATAQWHYFHARTNNATDSVPVIEQVRVSDHVMHTGQLCQEGLNCSCCRELLECQELAVNPTDGSSLVSYGGAGGIYVTKEVAGTSAIASLTITDRSGTCPIPDSCGITIPDGSPCIPPGLTVAVDPTGDVAQPPPVGTPQDDIQQVWIAEPYAPAGNHNLVFTMKVADLASLPVNRLWTILWNNPDPSDSFPRKFVQMNTCDPLMQPAFAYGRVEGSIQSGQGDAQGTYSADGTITITIDKNLVGNPQPFQVLSTIVGEVRLLIGAACSGSIQTLDMATGLQNYTVRGSAYCTAFSVTCPPPFIETARGTHVRSFIVNNPSTAARLFNVSLTDSKGWIVGGSISTTLGPVSPGSSASLTALFRAIIPCESEVDDIVFTATADDLPAPENARACSTAMTCCASPPTGTDHGIPAEFAFTLLGANPTRGNTAVFYALPERTPVRIDLFNVSGQRVRTVIDQPQEAGIYSLPFELRSDDGRAVGTGVYFLRIVTDRESRTVRVVSIR